LELLFAQPFGQFNQHFKSSLFANFLLPKNQTQTLKSFNPGKLHKTSLSEKPAHKMLVKLYAISSTFYKQLLC